MIGSSGESYQGDVSPKESKEGLELVVAQLVELLEKEQPAYFNERWLRVCSTSIHRMLRHLAPLEGTSKIDWGQILPLLPPSWAEKFVKGMPHRVDPAIIPETRAELDSKSGLSLASEPDENLQDQLVPEMEPQTSKDDAAAAMVAARIIDAEIDADPTEDVEPEYRWVMQKTLMKAERILSSYLENHRTDVLDEVIQTLEEVIRYYIRVLIIFANNDQVEDIRQECRIKLFKALEQFNPGQLKSFPAFVVRVIRNEIGHILRGDKGILPENVRDEAMSIYRRAVRHFKSEKGYEPDTAELAEFLGCGEGDVLAVTQEAITKAQFVSFESPIADTPDAVIGDTIYNKADNQYERVEARVLLNEALAGLTPEERATIQYQFIDGLSQTEVAAKLHRSQMQISRYKQSALAKMRPFFEEPISRRSKDNPHSPKKREGTKLAFMTAARRKLVEIKELS